MIISKIISANSMQAIAVCEGNIEQGDIALKVISIYAGGKQRANWICDHKFNSVESAFKAAQDWLAGQP